MTPRMEIAVDAWGPTVPDWIVALVNACDEVDSQKAVGKRLGYQSTIISTIIRNRYSASTEHFEARVRAILMPTDVECPLLGRIDTAVCLKWRTKASSGLRSATQLNVSMYRACERCPRYKPEVDE